MALQQGLYVEPGGSVSERIATRLELESTSTHMLVGGIGSGKTTQLLRIQQRLADVGDVRAFYVDVLARQRVARLNQPGVLLALAGLEMHPTFSSSLGSEELDKARLEIHRVASGEVIEFPEQDYDEDQWVPGIILRRHA